MQMKVFFTILVISILAFTSKAAVPVSGRIIEKSTGSPLEYANILLFSLPDSTFITGATSGEDGHFQFDNVNSGEYLLKILYVGLEPQLIPVQVITEPVVLEDILLKESNVLKEVVITPKQIPFRMGNNGGIVANVATTLLSTVGTANDVLQRMPGVTLLNDQITVFGKGTPIVYINNRRIYDNQELDRLESSEISTVELITNPGAKYDAEGRAVLLIKTKQKADGFALSLTERLSYASHWGDYENVNLSYTKNNLNLFTSYSHSYQKRKVDEKDKTTLFSSDSVWLHDSYLPYTALSAIHRLSTGFDWSVSDKHSVGGQYQYIYRDIKTNILSNTFTYLNNRLYDELISKMDMKTTPGQHLVNTFYKGEISKNYSLEIDYDYLKNHDYSYQQTFETSNMEDRTVNTYNQSDYNLYAGKLINSYNTSVGLFEFGGEYNHIIGNGFLTNPEGYTKNNIFTTTENKAAGFIDYSHTFNDFKLILGLRYEFAKSKATADSSRNVITDKKYNDFYPNFSLSKSINDWQLMLAFNSRAKRPNFSNLSGNVVYVNRYLFQKGNPYLKKTDIYDVNLQIIYKMFHLNTGFTYEKNPIMYDFTEDENPGATLATSVNFPKYKEIYATLSINHTLGFWLPNYTISVRKPYFSAFYKGSEKNYNTPDFSLMAYNDFKLPYSFIFSLNFNYSTNSFYYLSELRQNKYMNVGLRKSILDKRLTFNLEFRDMFDWLDTNFLVEANNVSFDQQIKRETRYGMLTITYQFNNYKKKYRGGSAAQDDINRF